MSNIFINTLRSARECINVINSGRELSEEEREAAVAFLEDISEFLLEKEIIIEDEINGPAISYVLNEI